MLFGEVAIGKGYIGSEELRQALEEQERRWRENKVNPFLGQVLVDLGHMTEKQVLDVLNTLHLQQIPK